MRPAAAFASVLLPPRAVGPSLVAASRSPPAAAATTYGEINTTSLLIRSVHFFLKKNCPQLRYIFKYNLRKSSEPF
jgi:hypothetical protein